MAADVSLASTEASGGLIAERAYLELRERIVTLRLAPGTVLREDALMAELGIGRTPLREAVKRLALENLVAVQPRRGTFVTDVDAADIVHITEVRAELEGYAAELAARRMDKAARAVARALLEEVERPDARLDDEDQDSLIHVDQRIHRLTWEASRNPYLVETLERYFLLSLRIWYLVLDRVPGLGPAVHDQAELLRALLERDGAPGAERRPRARARLPGRDRRGVQPRLSAQAPGSTASASSVATSATRMSRPLLRHAVVEHHGAERARDRERVGAGGGRLAHALLVDRPRVLLHPHVRAAGAAAERAPVAAAPSRSAGRPPRRARAAARARRCGGPGSRSRGR